MKLAKLGDDPEIFHTIQGEGVSAGCPAVFIRSSRCNLHCVWCDTDHTWNFEGTPWPHEKDADPTYRKHCKETVTIEVSAKEAAEKVLSYQCPRVVITGGEPLLQEAEFLEMIKLVREEMPNCQFEVETNSTQIPSPAMAVAVDQFNVSPKLSNSGMDESLRLKPDGLKHFSRDPKSWFKFVVNQPSDLDEIDELCSRYQIPAERVLLMPEGRTSEELDRNAPWLADTCKNKGFRLCDRLHVRIWGDQRGV